jgi:general secretion pathway protein B
MSYILEALKKSEKQRQRGTVPDILTIQEPILRKPKKRQILLYLLLTAIILNTALSVWLLSPWQPKKSNLSQITDRQQIELKSLKPPSPELSKANTPEVKTAIKKELPEEVNYVKTQTKNTVNADQQKHTVEGKDNLQKKIQVNQQITTDIAGLPKISPVAPQKVETPDHVSTKQKINISEAPFLNKIYNLNELPSPIQQSLPTFNISVSLYSADPASRMAKINGQVMKEGQFLSAGLKLEEIIPDGVILSYQNYRFRVGLR